MHGRRQWISANKRSARTRAQDRRRTGERSRWTSRQEVWTRGILLDIDVPLRRRATPRSGPRSQLTAAKRPSTRPDYNLIDSLLFVISHRILFAYEWPP